MPVYSNKKFSYKYVFHLNRKKKKVKTQEDTIPFPLSKHFKAEEECDLKSATCHSKLAECLLLDLCWHTKSIP